MALRFDHHYKIKQGDDLGDPLFWNTRLQDIDLRINALEAGYTKIATAPQELIGLGLDRINNTFQPLLNDLTNTVTSLQMQVTTLTDELNAESGTVTEQLNSIIAQASDLLAELEGLGTIDGGTF